MHKGGVNRRANSPSLLEQAVGTLDFVESCYRVSLSMMIEFSGQNHLASRYAAAVLQVKRDLECGTVQPECSGRTLGNGCSSACSPRSFQTSRSMIRMVYNSDLKTRICERRIAQTEPELETRGYIILQSSVSEQMIIVEGKDIRHRSVGNQ